MSLENDQSDQRESCGEEQRPLVVGLFVKEPVPGRVKSRLGAEIGNAKSAKLYELFVIDLVEKFTTLPERLVIGYAPESPSAKRWVKGLFEVEKKEEDFWAQPECGLGERISAFFEYAFVELEAESVVLIGSDSPTIPKEYVHQAFEWLYQKDCVIGPSSDGGYYLIGLRARCKDIFCGIDWSTSKVLKQTVAKISEANLSLKLLPIWYDVDSKDDLQMLQGHLSALNRVGETDLPLLTAAWISNWKQATSSNKEPN